MSQYMHWDAAKLVAEAHHHDLHKLADPLIPAEKPVKPEAAPHLTQRTKVSVVLAVIVALSKR